MIAFIVIAATVLVTMGAAIGVIAVVSLGIRREERNYSLESEIEDPMTRGVRRMTGFSFSRPSFSLLTRESQITTKGPAAADKGHTLDDSTMSESIKASGTGQ